jgi:hypothetical protein
MKTVKGWWFSEGYRLPYEDNRIIKIGKTHKIKGEIIPCENGLHASERIIDALDYAPGSIIWKVELSGTVIKGKDKLCASSRKYLSGGVDCSEVLRKFTRLCALDVIHLWDAPQVVIDYLKTGDESIRPAAWSAAEAVTWSAARYAAESQAAFATWSAAFSAAESTARYAARYTTRSATWSAARSAAEHAAGTAAEYTARSAAENAQNKRLTVMINQLIKKGL